VGGGVEGGSCPRAQQMTGAKPLFYENALIDTENAFLNFIKTHGGNVQKRTEKLYGNAQG